VYSTKQCSHCGTTAARPQLAVDSDLRLTEISIDSLAKAIVMCSLELSSVIPLAMGDRNHWETDLWEYAVRHNSLLLLQWLHSHGFSTQGLIAEAADAAVEYDFVELLNWLDSVSGATIWTDEYMDDLFYDAGRFASFDVLEWFLHETGNFTILPFV
jgi:hypothetical protein